MPMILGMLLRGSCHCQRVTFTVESRTPYPYMRCYCSICRKTAGGGGYAINIMGLAETLSVSGSEHARIYQADLGVDAAGQPRGRSPGQRHFCGTCASCLYIIDPRWSEWVYPFASAIDTPLPNPPERVHIMEAFAASWIDIPTGASEHHLEEYPEDSIEAWHRARGLELPR